jgi:GntR family transcriptional regulator, transcriptional repressor for pyruvate dehydrogenase complex
MSLTPLSRSPTAAEVCATALTDALLQGTLSPGEKLPPERALAEQLGVDRGTLRSGLQRLVAAGLLTQRQGAGTVAHDWQEVGGLDLLVPLLSGRAGRALRDHVRDLLLLRRHLAAAVLEALVGGARPEDVRRVAKSVATFEALVAKRAADVTSVSDLALARADLCVLRSVVQATRRPVLRLALNPITAIFLRLPALQRAVVADAALSVPAYQALLGWLKEPGPGGPAALLALLAARDELTLERLARSSR